MIALDSMLFLSYESDEGERRERKFSLFSPSPLSRSEINMAANVESLRQNNPDPEGQPHLQSASLNIVVT